MKRAAQIASSSAADLPCVGHWTPARCQRDCGGRIFTVTQEADGGEAEGARALAGALLNNDTLMYFSIGSNAIGVEGAKSMATAVEKNKALKLVDLSENDLGAEGCMLMAKAATQNTTLTTLDLERNEIGRAHV